MFYAEDIRRRWQIAKVGGYLSSIKIGFFYSQNGSEIPSDFKIHHRYSFTVKFFHGLSLSLSNWICLCIHLHGKLSLCFCFLLFFAPSNSILVYCIIHIPYIRYVPSCQTYTQICTQIYIHTFIFDTVNGTWCIVRPVQVVWTLTHVRVYRLHTLQKHKVYNCFSRPATTAWMAVWLNSL